MKNIIAYIMAFAFLNACASRKIKKFTPEVKWSKTDSQNPIKNKCKINKVQKMGNTEFYKQLLINFGKDSFKKYSFDFVDVDIQEAILELTEQTGIPMVIDENVTGTVTVSLNNKRLPYILDALASTGPFDYKVKKKYIYFGNSSLETGAWAKLAYNYRYKTQTFQPSTIKKLVNPIYHDFIIADDKSHQMTIYAPRTEVIDIMNIIYQVDRPQQQIALRMSITEIKDGIHSIFGRKNFNSSYIKQSIGFSGLEELMEDGMLITNAYGKFLKLLNFMRRKGLANIRAQPSLIVLEGEEAKVHSNNKRILINDNYRSENNKLGVDLNIGFSITPKIADNGHIILKINEAGTGDYNQKDKDDFEVSQQTIKTTVKVKPGQTIILGGLKRETSKITMTKIPILGDIPLISGFFKSKEKEKQETEVLFAIKPEIRCL